MSSFLRFSFIPVWKSNFHSQRVPEDFKETPFWTLSGPQIALEIFPKKAYEKKEPILNQRKATYLSQTETSVEWVLRPVSSGRLKEEVCFKKYVYKTL